MDALHHSRQRLTTYIGFDCTAHGCMSARWFVVVLAAFLATGRWRECGGTTRVGDPSGKDESRRLLNDEAINDNLKGIRAGAFTKFLKFDDAGGDAIVANDADWLDALNYIDFLRDVGRHFSINRMSAPSNWVKLRLDRQQELSFLEFDYMILQAYDFVELHRRYGCALQWAAPGGQYRRWHRSRPPPAQRSIFRANLTARSPPHQAPRWARPPPARCDSTPRIRPVRTSGNTKATPQNCNISSFLKLFTILPLDEIARLAALKHHKINEAKRISRHRVGALCARPPGRRGRRREDTDHE